MLIGGRRLNFPGMDIPQIGIEPMSITVPAPAPRSQGNGRAWAGILADMLAGALGQPGMYAQSMERRRQEQAALDREEQQYTRRRLDKRDDMIWERDNIPRAPYRWESNDGSLMEMGADGLVRTVYKDPTPKMNFIPDGMGGGQWVASPTVPVQTPQSPADLKPVGRLTPLNGGPTPRASGGFPR
jgi:hypothetical protein